MMIFEITWSNNDVLFEELANVYVSIAEKFKLNEVYEIARDEGSGTKTPYAPDAPLYFIKAVCCFLGAHYLSFVRKEKSTGESYW